MRLVRVGELAQAAEGQLPDAGEVLGLGVERRLQEAQRGRRQGEDLIGAAAHLGAELRRGHDPVHQSPALGAGRVVAAAQEPDLPRALLADDARQIACAEAGVERADARAGLAELGVLGRDREIAQQVQDMAAADRIAVDRCDHGLGHLADRPVQRLHLEQPARGGPIVPALRALLLVATDAERPLARACQRRDADRRVRPGSLERGDQLIDRARAEGVQPLRAVDRDPREPVVDLVGYVLHAGEGCQWRRT